MIKKAMELIGKHPFKQLARDPTSKNEKRVNDLLKKLEKDGAVDKKLLSALRLPVGSSQPPLFYGRVKLHKQDYPIRPIVSAVGSCTHKVAKTVERCLAPYSRKVPSYIKNTKELIDKLKEVEIGVDEVLMSFDVQSLFTSVPVNDALAAVSKRLRNDDSVKQRTGMADETIMTSLKLCLGITAFQFRGNPYELEDGPAMGSPVSPVVANIFMAELETKALEGFGCAPSVWYRYVDDVLSVVKRSLVQSLLDHLNGQHESITFTVEMEENGVLPFMDVVLKRSVSGKIETAVYRKPSHTERYLQFSSHRPLG